MLGLILWLVYNLYNLVILVCVCHVALSLATSPAFIRSSPFSPGERNLLLLTLSLNSLSLPSVCLLVPASAPTLLSFLSYPFLNSDITRKYNLKGKSLIIWLLPSFFPFFCIFSELWCRGCVTGVSGEAAHCTVAVFTFKGLSSIPRPQGAFMEDWQDQWLPSNTSGESPICKRNFWDLI